MKKLCFFLSIIWPSLAILLFPWAVTARAGQGIINEAPSIRFMGATVLTDASGSEMPIGSRVRVKGDINGDGLVLLADAVLALQIMINGGGNIAPCLTAEVNGDCKIRLEETIFILQVLSDLRENLPRRSLISISGNTQAQGERWSSLSRCSRTSE